MKMRKLRILLLRLSAVPFVFLAVFIRPPWNVESTTAFAVELLGYLFLLGGLAIRIWSILYIGGRKSHELITEGPYSLCRNPLYVGTLFLVIGAGLCFENVLMLAATLVVFIPVHFIVVRLEEKHLESLFPIEYASYRRQTSRFLPQFRNYHGTKELTVSVRSIRRVLVDTMGVLLLPEIEDLLEVMHRHGIIPVLWHFP